MRSDLTVVIPTHNRHHYLGRCVTWFKDLGCPIVIADSTNTPWTSDLRAHEMIKYLHHPGGFEVYRAKLQAALAAVDTPLVMMCADDDFAAFDAIEQSIRFLEKNPDFESCAGYSYLFQRFGGALVLWPMVYPYHDLQDAEWQQRLPHASSTVYYTVNRTATLRLAVDFVARRDLEGMDDLFVGLIDTSLTWNAARAGKFKRLPVPYGFREYSPNVSATGKRHRTIVSPQIAQFYKALCGFILRDDENPDDMELMLRLSARDYAGQISYDLALPPSRKRLVSRLPTKTQLTAEKYFRILTAAKMYATPEYREFMSVFRHPEWKRLKHFVLGESAS